jgi:hypothetical protein
VNNAGVSHAGKSGRSVEEIVKSGRASVAPDEVRAVFDTNVFVSSPIAVPDEACVTIANLPEFCIDLTLPAAFE